MILPSLHISYLQRRPVKSNRSLVRTRMDPNAWGSRKLCKLCSSSICVELARWVDLLRSPCLWNSYAPGTKSEFLNLCSGDLQLKGTIYLQRFAPWQPGPCMSGGRCCSSWNFAATTKSMENMEQLVCLTEELTATHCVKHCSDSFAQFSILTVKD